MYKHCFNCLCQERVIPLSKRNFVALTPVRCFSLASCTKQNAKNYYDLLEITPKSSQDEIKASYYRLSKLYHPDSNKGNPENISKFHDIAEAYEILSNPTSRKSYDTGQRISNPSTSSKGFYAAADPQADFFKSRLRKGDLTFKRGRPNNYNYDDWMENHYSQSFQRSRFRRMEEKDFADWKKSREKANLHWNSWPFYTLIFTFFCYELLSFTARDVAYTNSRKPVEE